MTDAGVSPATVGRLPTYLRTLVDLAADNVANVSSQQLAEMVGVNPASLRRDFSTLSITGTRGVGYDVKAALVTISAALGVDQQWPVVVMGAGNLGRALVNYGGLAERGFPIRAVLDIDPDKVGSPVGSLEVLHADRLVDVIAEHDILVAVIATPTSAAQHVYDELVEAGVGSVLNFTGEKLVNHSADSSIDPVVRDVDIATELQILSFYQQRGTVEDRLGVGAVIGPTGDPATGDLG